MLPYKAWSWAVGFWGRVEERKVEGKEADKLTTCKLDYRIEINKICILSLFPLPQNKNREQYQEFLE